METETPKVVDLDDQDLEDILNAAGLGFDQDSNGEVEAVWVENAERKVKHGEYVGTVSEMARLCIFAAGIKSPEAAQALVEQGAREYDEAFPSEVEEEREEELFSKPDDDSENKDEYLLKLDDSEDKEGIDKVKSSTLKDEIQKEGKPDAVKTKDSAEKPKAESSSSVGQKAPEKIESPPNARQEISPEPAQPKEKTIAKEIAAPLPAKKASVTEVDKKDIATKKQPPRRQNPQELAERPTTPANNLKQVEKKPRNDSQSLVTAKSVETQTQMPEAKPLVLPPQIDKRKKPSLPEPISKEATKELSPPEISQVQPEFVEKITTELILTEPTVLEYITPPIKEALVIGATKKVQMPEIKPPLLQPQSDKHKKLAVVVPASKVALPEFPDPETGKAQPVFVEENTTHSIEVKPVITLDRDEGWPLETTSSVESIRPKDPFDETDEPLPGDQAPILFSAPALFEDNPAQQAELAPDLQTYFATLEPEKVEWTEEIFETIVEKSSLVVELSASVSPHPEEIAAHEAEIEELVLLLFETLGIEHREETKKLFKKALTEEIVAYCGNLEAFSQDPGLEEGTHEQKRGMIVRIAKKMRDFIKNQLHKLIGRSALRLHQLESAFIKQALVLQAGN